MLWTFARNNERISIGRRTVACALVIVRPDDERREYRFPDDDALMQFQADMEEFLLTTGWTLLKFGPERRRGLDRRRFPRLEERRRWWTDGAEIGKVEERRPRRSRVV